PAGSVAASRGSSGAQEAGGAQAKLVPCLPRRRRRDEAGERTGARRVQRAGGPLALDRRQCLAAEESAPARHRLGGAEGVGGEEGGELGADRAVEGRPVPVELREPPAARARPVATVGR